MRRFFEGLFVMVAEIVIGGFWAFLIIGGTVLCWFIGYALITGFMR